MMLICTLVTVPVVGMEFSVNTILTSVSGIGIACFCLEGMNIEQFLHSS